eukprot:TRINITY_DN1346_c7_g1_i1.p1 TRINITY_DN1346_c7_g1~~TRINITY_DN1346_c7_g1_i1.p1  ORF type:complete len:254 (+),score=68.42 TRINITY_DN1346_c7_g1_i1:75-836(+)
MKAVKKSPEQEALEQEVCQNVKQMRDDGMKAVYLERMKKLRGEVEKTGLFKDGVFHDFTPQQFVQFAWGSGDTETVALNGNFLAAKDIAPKPSYLFEAGDGIKYCVVAFDADARDGPYLLWVRFGIEGDPQYSTGRDWFRWQPPTPEEGTGKHRVYLMVFHQKTPMEPERLKVISKFSTENRSKFDPKRFAQKFGLDIVIGCNSCVTQWDPSVDKVRASFKETVEMSENSGKRDPEAHPCEGSWGAVPTSQEP